MPGPHMVDATPILSAVDAAAGGMRGGVARVLRGIAQDTGRDPESVRRSLERARGRGTIAQRTAEDIRQSVGAPAPVVRDTPECRDCGAVLSRYNPHPTLCHRCQ